MVRTLTLIAALTMPAPGTETWTGWFSDAQCASPPAPGDVVRPNNAECVKRCLAKGVKPVFLSEQARAVFGVLGLPSAKDHIGYRLEVRGVVDEQAQTITIQSLKRLEYTGAMCIVPKKTSRP